MEKFDVIIIGAGPAGLTAAIYLARANRKVAVVERMTAGGQAGAINDIENYPGVKNVSGYDLIETMEDQAKSFGAKFVRGDVAKFDAGTKTVTLAKGDTLTANAVILATGCKAKALGVAREDELSGRGVSSCAHCDGFFFKGKVVAVAGGGPKAPEEAKYLASVASKVYYITSRGDEIEGCETVKGRVTELIGTPLDAIVVASGGEEKTLEVAGLFTSVGYVPQTHLFHAFAGEDGYIATDEFCKVADGLYAVGDIRRKRLRQIVTAAADGAVAADDIIRSIPKMR